MGQSTRLARLSRPGLRYEAARIQDLHHPGAPVARHAPEPVHREMAVKRRQGPLGVLRLIGRLLALAQRTVSEHPPTAEQTLNG